MALAIDTTKKIKKGVFYKNTPFRSYAVSCGARVVGFISITEPSKLVEKAIGWLNAT